MCRVDRLLLLDLCEIIDIDPEAMKVPHFDIMKVKEEEEDKEDDDHGATIESNTIKTTDKTTDKSIEIINKSAPPESFGGFGAGAFPF